MIVLSLASLVFGAAIASSTPVAAGAASPATATAPAGVGAAAARHRGHHDDTLVAGRSTEPSDGDAIQEQFRLRVLTPALSGDGGG